MKATVKNVNPKTSLVKDENYSDVFSFAMAQYVGKEIEVVRIVGSSKWFRDCGEGWTWHESWLDFGGKVKGITSTVKMEESEVKKPVYPVLKSMTDIFGDLVVVLFTEKNMGMCLHSSKGS